MDDVRRILNLNFSPKWMRQWKRWADFNYTLIISFSISWCYTQFQSDPRNVSAEADPDFPIRHTRRVFPRQEPQISAPSGHGGRIHQRRRPQLLLPILQGFPFCFSPFHLSISFNLICLFPLTSFERLCSRDFGLVRTWPAVATCGGIWFLPKPIQLDAFRNLYHFRFVVVVVDDLF